MREFLGKTIGMLIEQIKKNKDHEGGSTFCGVFIDLMKGKYYSINIGDSRLLRIKKGIKKFQIEFITTDHKLTNEHELQRIKAK